MEFEKTMSDLRGGARLVDHSSGGKILTKGGRYQPDTFVPLPDKQGVKSMGFEEIASDLRGRAKLIDHSSGGKLLSKAGRYLNDTFLSPRRLFEIRAGVWIAVAVSAVGLIWWKWDWIKSMAASTWEVLCNVYEETAEFCTSTLEAAWYWLGFEDGSEQPA